jgi:hypothetical protein
MDGARSIVGLPGLFIPKVLMKKKGWVEVFSLFLPRAEMGCEAG